jgi:5-methylcytosine-specific restriction endonuclease McrA
MKREEKQKIKRSIKSGRIYSTKRYATWRTKVFKRDRFKCQLCSKVGGYLEAHHIKLKSKHPELTFTVSNGITLCGRCHKTKVHKDEDSHKKYTRKFNKLAKENKPKPRITRAGKKARRLR